MSGKPLAGQAEQDSYEMTVTVGTSRQVRDKKKRQPVENSQDRTARTDCYDWTNMAGQDCVDRMP
jgi:hypothetical protein